MKILKWIDKNTYEFDGTVISSFNDIGRNQLANLFAKHFVVIQKEPEIWYVI